MGAYIKKLNAPLLRLSKYDHFTLRDALEGTLIFGATGSGKTSSTGAALISAYLRSGFGGLVLCAKPEECALWERHAQTHGRSHHLLIVDENSDYRFNFLEYELLQSASSHAAAENLTQLIIYLSEMAGSGSLGSSDNPFWRNSVTELLSNAIETLRAAYGEVTFENILKMATSAPRSVGESKDEEFQKSS